MSSTGALIPGTLVAGRYQVQEPLAGEGSAAVYRAADTRLDRPVALRALPAAEAGGAQQGKAAARLVHPNVARVLDFGSDTEQALEFVVADLGTGGSLAALLAQRGVPPLPLAMRMIQEAAAGMAAAHRAGLVHGDLHPGVLWLSRDEGRLQVRVLGLGLNPAGSPPPRATARYAAPERLRRARELTSATDVFSLGVIAHEVFAGLPEEWTQLLLQMARGQAVVAPSLLEARPELPAHVAHAVRRALMSDPASRWPDAGELAAHLIADAATPQHAEAQAPSIAAPAVVAAPALADPPPAPTLESVVAGLGADDERDTESVTIPTSEPAATVFEAATPESVASIDDAAPAAEADAAPGAVPDLAPTVAEAAPPALADVQAPPAAASAGAAVDSAPPEAPKPARQPLTAGRRGKSITLASTDLADTLYIPPAIEKPAAEPASARPAASTEKPAAPVTPPLPIAAAPTPKPKPEPKSEPKPEPVSAPVIALKPEAPAPAADETLAAAYTAALPASQGEPAPAAAPADDTAPIPLPDRRRRNGLARLGSAPSGGSKRGLIAAGIAVAVLVGGGVVAKTLIARPGATPQVAQNLTSQAAASLGAAPSPAQPHAPTADSAALAAPPPLAPADTAGLTPAEKRRQEEERRRLEEQRRLQQRQQDSLRQAQLAANAAQPPAPEPQQVALQSAPRPVTGVPAPQLGQRPAAPAATPPALAAAAPPRPAADPNRLYSAEELDTAPSLANAPAFRSAISRSYPTDLQGTNTWGSAVVSFVVRPDGTVERGSISVVEASHPAFRGAAMTAISRARFNPARVGGQAVRTQVSMPITWRGGERDDD